MKQPSPSPVLALDIGNTRAHVGIVDNVRHICLVSAAFPVAEIEQRLSSAIEALIGKAGIPVGRNAAIAGVVQNAISVAERVVQLDGYIVNQLTSVAPLPFAIRYDTPHTLGADRIANALYASTVYPGRSVVCISTGTAIVIDYVADNTYFGGAILPGIRLQLTSLHLGTDALPDFGNDASIKIPAIPGTSTQNSMIGGVVRGAAAAIGGVVAEYVGSSHEIQPLILATGGDWRLVAPLVKFNVVEVPDMTLVGTASLLNYV